MSTQPTAHTSIFMHLEMFFSTDGCKGAYIHTSITCVAQVFINSSHQMRCRKKPRGFRFCEFFQEKTGTGTTVAHKFRSMFRVCRDVNETCIFCFFEKLKGFLFIDESSNTFLHHKFGSFIKGHTYFAGMMTWILGLAETKSH